jgi:hypothetical protein
MIKINVQYMHVYKFYDVIIIAYSSKKSTGDFYLLDDVSVLPHSYNGGCFHKVPVFEAVVDHASVEGVMVAAVLLLEVAVAMVVGLLIGRNITDDHVELCGKRREKGVAYRSIS